MRVRISAAFIWAPPTLTSHQRDEALRDLAKGSATQADLARRLNVSRSKISRFAL